MADTDQEWLPGRNQQGGAQDHLDQAGGEAGHQGTPDFWFRRSGRLKRGEKGWERRDRGGRLLKITYN